MAICRYTINNKPYLAKNISQSFAQQLNNHITQTRKFIVLDRAYQDDYLQEKNFALSANLALDEQLKLSGALGLII